MRLNIIQIVLGLGIILAMAFSIAWDPTGFYVRESLGEPGSWETIFNPDVKEVVATVLAFFVLLLGLAIIGVSIALLTVKIRFEYVEPNFKMNIRVKRLVITQMGLGLLVTVSALLVTSWGFPTSYLFTISDNIKHGVFFTPSHQFVIAQLLSLCTFLLGIVSLACGLVQPRAARLSKVLPNAT